MLAEAGITNSSRFLAQTALRIRRTPLAAAKSIDYFLIEIPQTLKYTLHVYSH
jgi:hypothetical protein